MGMGKNEMGKSVLRTREIDLSSKTATVRNRTFSPVRPRSVTMKSDQKLRVTPPVPRPRSTTFSLVEFQRVTEEIRMQCEEKRDANERAARGECEQASRMIEKRNRRMKKFEQSFDEILDKVNSRPRTFADEFLDESEIYKTMGRSKIYRRCREEKVIRDTVIRMSDQVLLKNLRKFFQRSYAITFSSRQFLENQLIKALLYKETNNNQITRSIIVC